VGDLGDARFTASFSANVEGDIDSVAIPFEPTVPPIVFQRRPAPSLRDRDVLEQFSGDYTMMDQMMSVTIKGEDALLLSLPDCRLPREQSRSVPTRQNVRVE